MSRRINKFDPSTLRPYRIILCVGKRGTGKSVLLQDLMYHIRANVDICCAMSPTQENLTNYEKLMPRSFVHERFEEPTLTALVAHQRAVARKQEPYRILVVLDDLMYDKSVLKATCIREIFMNGRHLRITLINAMQYVMDMSPDLRSQIDYVFALRENIIANRKKLYNFFFGMFPTFDEFEKVMNACTGDHDCLVMDNTIGSNNISECVFWYKAKLTQPTFKLCRSRFWLKDSCYFCGDEGLDATAGASKKVHKRKQAGDSMEGGGGVPSGQKIVRLRE